MKRTKKFFKHRTFPPVTIANYYGKFIYINYDFKGVAENIDAPDVKFWPTPKMLDIDEWCARVKQNEKD
jgi:hypothetical protein